MIENVCQGIIFIAGVGLLLYVFLVPYIDLWEMTHSYQDNEQK